MSRGRRAGLLENFRIEGDSAPSLTRPGALTGAGQMLNVAKETLSPSLTLPRL
jgi:hypothetical protein